MNVIFSVLFNFFLFIFLIFLFRKELIADFKSFDFKSSIFCILKYWAFISIFNFIFYMIVSNISNNQIQLNEMKESYFIVVVLLSSLTAPFIEEIIFRLSLKVLIKKEIIFIIVSSFAFAIMHIIPINNFDDLIYLINYGFMGFILAYSYVKHKNIWFPISIHILNNIMANIMPLLMS